MRFTHLYRGDIGGGAVPPPGKKIEFGALKWHILVRTLAHKHKRAAIACLKHMLQICSFTFHLLEISRPDSQFD